MSSIEAIRKNRLKKLQNIQKAKVNPYPAKTQRTHSCQVALDNFEELAVAQSQIILAGRLRSIREHGGSTFAHLEDDSGKIQLYFKRDKLGKKQYQFFQDNLDIGDFIQATGVLFTTKKGEKTLEVKDYQILAKGLRPLPEKWHGLKDVEERFRQRYLDLLMNKEVGQKFAIRSLIIQAIRKFLEEKGFIEVETPILQQIPGGALARPFKTHLNTLNLDLYLRVAPELFLKRCLVGGLEKVYEIGRCFRNEGIDSAHNPDFTMLEFYWAYADYEDLMKMTEEMFVSVLDSLSEGATPSDRTISYQGEKINFATPWPRVEFEDLIKEHCQIKITKADLKTCQEKVKEAGLEVEPEASKYELIDELFKKVCRSKIIQPTFVVHHPIELSPLAKGLEKDPQKAARFQLIIGGLELVNAFSELNDPLEQDKRFQEQEAKYRAGSQEAQRYDKDFIRALEYGLPPAAGFGLGLDRLVALLTDSHSLREVILFPLMKPK